MNRLRVRHTTLYTYKTKASLCQNLVRLTPRDTFGQRVLEHQIEIEPRPTYLQSRLDYFGNRLHYFTLQDPHLRLQITMHALVEVAAMLVPQAEQTPPWESAVHQPGVKDAYLPLEALPFVFGSAKAPRSERLLEYAAPSFTPGRPLLAACLDLNQRIHTDFEYEPGVTTVHTTVEEAFDKRQGVCQDFAHIFISCLRSLGIAARYISGYLLTRPPEGQERLIGADATHAWIAVYCPGHDWIELDPTNNIIPTGDHITAAWGRDYADVAPIGGVYSGGEDQDIAVAVDVAPEPESPPSAYTASAPVEPN